MAASDFYESRWGRVKLWISRIMDDRSRTVVTLSPAVGSEHTRQDRGDAPHDVTAELLFAEIPSDPMKPVDRLLLFDAQVRAGEPQIFVHPLYGAYLARVEGWQHEIDATSNIASATVTFLAESPAEQVRTADAGTSLTAGAAAVDAAAETLDAALADVDVESDVPATAKAAVEAWSESDDVPTREVLATAADMRTQIEDMIAVNGFEDDLAYWDAYIAAVELQAAFRSAALAATASTPKLFLLRIEAPTSVLALVTRVYGGTEAEDREVQVRALNDIVTVGGLIQAGTELQMPQLGSSLAA